MNDGMNECLFNASSQRMSFRMQKSNMGKVEKISQLYLQLVVKTFSKSCIGRTVVKIKQTRLMLCSAAMDEAMDDTNLIGYEIYELP